MANVVMVGGFAAATGALTKTSVEHAIKEKFPGKLGELNAVVAAEAFDYVSSINSKVQAVHHEEPVKHQIEVSQGVAQTVASPVSHDSFLGVSLRVWLVIPHVRFLWFGHCRRRGRFVSEMK